MSDTSVRVTTDIVSVFAVIPAWDPTTITGAGVTTDIVSVFAVPDSAARVTSHVVAVFVTDIGAGQTTDPGCGGTPISVTHAFGYAV